MSEATASPIDRDLERFYARNPALAKETAVSDYRDVNPIDKGTVSWEDALDLNPTVADMDYRTELRPLLRKRLVWDIVPDDKVQEWSAGLKINRSSDQGNVVEQALSETRRRRLANLMPVLRVASMTAGEVLSRAKMLDAGDTSGTFVMNSEHDVVAEVVQGTEAVIANLLDLGFLQYGKVVTGSDV